MKKARPSERLENIKEEEKKEKGRRTADRKKEHKLEDTKWFLIY